MTLKNDQFADLGLSHPARNRLLAAGYKSVEHIIGSGYTDLLRKPNIGNKYAREIWSAVGGGGRPWDANKDGPLTIVPGWSPIESAPHNDPKARVLIWTAHRALDIGYNDIGGDRQCWRDMEGDELIDPTHWMPLPNPPD